MMFYVVGAEICTPVKREAVCESRAQSLTNIKSVWSSEIVRSGSSAQGV